MKPEFVLVHSPEGIEEAKTRLAGSSRLPPSRGGFLAGLLGRHLGGGSFDRMRDLWGAHFRLRHWAGARAPSDPSVQVTVGIWSLDAWLGGLAKLVESLNRVQSALVFYEVEAAVPAGLISRPERLIPWLREALGEEPDEESKRAIEDNLVANDFFGLAERIRADLHLDYLIGVTPSMVAGEDDGQYYWNHFSTFEGRAILASSYQLHEFARLADRPFEAFLTKLIVSQVLVAMFYPRLGFHPDRGCLFDYDASRISLIDKVIDPKIEPECLHTIEAHYRQAALAFVDFLSSFRSAKG